MLDKLHIAISLACFLLLFGINTSDVLGYSIFYDNFDSGNDYLWTYSLNNGNIEFYDGSIILSSNSQQFPYIQNNFEIQDPGDYKIKIRFKFEHVGGLGNGIGIGFIEPGIQNKYQIGIWGDQENKIFLYYNDFSLPSQGSCKDFSIASNTRNRKIFLTNSTDSNWHVFELNKVGSRFKLFLDNRLLYQSPLYQCNPKRIWLGNNFGVQGGTDWSIAKIDYINYFIGNENVHNKLIIVPGMGASWNTRALVDGVGVDYSQWKMTPFVDIYDDLMSQLEFNGYIKNYDYWVWNYDWRRPISENVNKLNDFVNSNVGANEKVDLVGHSMGGVIARVWQQQNMNSNKTGKVISLSGPQNGSIKAYETWSGGTIEDSGDISSLALSILTKLHARSGITTVNTIRTYSPSLKDLLPTFDFLKKNSVLVASNNLSSKNDFLVTVNTAIPNIWSGFDASVGTSIPTKSEVWVGERNIYDKVLGNWPDGVPVRYTYENTGDGAVLKKSAKFDQDEGGYFEVNAGHGDIVDKSLGMIAEKLGLQTTISPLPNMDLKNKLIFHLGSPAYLKVKCDNFGEVRSDEMGFVILDKTTGMCKADVVSTGEGQYHLTVGNGGDIGSWRSWMGTIAAGETQTVTVAASNGKIETQIDNKAFLRSVTGSAIDVLLSPDPNNVNLLATKNYFVNQNYKMALEYLFKFRKEKAESGIGDEVVSNLELLVSSTGETVTLTMINNEKYNLARAVSSVDMATRINQTQGKIPSVFGAANYKKYEEYKRLADSNLRNNLNQAAYWDLKIAGKYIGQVW